MSKKLSILLKYGLLIVVFLSIVYLLCLPINSGAAYKSSTVLVNTFTIADVADGLRIQWVPYPYSNNAAGDDGGGVGGEEGGSEEIGGEIGGEEVEEDGIA